MEEEAIARLRSVSFAIVPKNTNLRDKKEAVGKKHGQPEVARSLSDLNEDGSEHKDQY